MLTESAVRLIRSYRWVMYPIYEATGLTSICKLTPSCSHYAEEAVRTHGVGKTVVMTAARLKRCGHTDHTDDPVPPAPYSPTREERMEAGKMLAITGFTAVGAFWMGRRLVR